MNLFTTICVTRLRRDSGKARHYQASYSPPAGCALFQHSRAKRITRSPQESAAPPRGRGLVAGTAGAWPAMRRKKADRRPAGKLFGLGCQHAAHKSGRAGPGQAGGGQGPGGGTGVRASAAFPAPQRRALGLGEGPDARRSPQLGPRLRVGREPVWAPFFCKGDLA